MKDKCPRCNSPLVEVSEYGEGVFGCGTVESGKTVTQVGKKCLSYEDLKAHYIRLYTASHMISADLACRLLIADPEGSESGRSSVEAHKSALLNVLTEIPRF